MGKVAAVLCLVASLFATGCRPAQRPRASVAVSVFPLYDLVRRIAGADADVLLVLPAGTSPEGWIPPPDTVARVGGATLLVSVGLGVDPWMDALVSAAAPKARVLRLGDRVPTISSEDGAINGYVWMDPQRARLMATAIAEDLARVDPSHAIAFRERASVLDGALASLDREIEARTASWKHEGGTLPPGMAYYGERYGLHPLPPAVGNAGRPLDLLGGTDPKVATYEDLIRFDTFLVEPGFR